MIDTTLAAIYGTCPTCGSHRTLHRATQTQADGTIAQWEFLACATDLSHSLEPDEVAPSDPVRYPHNTTDEAS